MKHRFFICITAFLLFSSCSGCFSLFSSAPEESSPARESEKLKITVSLFPLYDFARIIGGDRVEATLLLPPGAESHTFEPTPGDMAAVYASDLFIYTGPDMEPWAHTLIQNAPDSLSVVNAAEDIPRLSEEHDEDGEEHSEDPHIWLDPTLAAEMASAIARGLSAADPDGGDYYQNNADAYRAELTALDEDFWTVVQNGKRNTLVFGGRFAYQYFLHRYGLNYKTAYQSCAAEAEPGIKEILELCQYIDNEQIPCVYYEELTEPRVALSICGQTGAQPLLFSTVHSVGKDDFQNGVTYMDIMRQNLENVQIGLG